MHGFAKSIKPYLGDGAPAPPQHTGGTAKIHPKLSSYINYIQSVHFAGFDAAAEKDLTFQVRLNVPGKGKLKNLSSDVVIFRKRRLGLSEIPGENM